MVTKRQILTGIKAVTGFLTPSEKTAEMFISMGLERLDASWFQQAIPAWKKAQADGESEELKKLYDPVPYLEGFFNQNRTTALAYIRSWWKYMEPIILNPNRLMLILLRKEDCRKYLNSEDGHNYVVWMAQDVYSWIYEFTWETED